MSNSLVTRRRLASLLLLPLSLSCGHSPEHNDTPIGVLSMPLETEVDGIGYRLRDDEFFVTGPETFTLQSSDDAFLQRSVSAGDYQIELLDGWRLEREVGAEFQHVVARLASPNPVGFQIFAERTTRVPFVFATAGVSVNFAPGILDIQLEVDDSSRPRVLHGDVRLSSQAQVQALSGVQRITGVLTITGSVTDLSPLASLTEIDVALAVTSAAQLTSLEGLDQLRTIGDGFGGLAISDNPALTDLDALSGLTNAPGLELHVSRNPRLENIDGLRNVTGYGNFVTIEGNPALTSLGGLSGLSGNGGLWITNNAALTSLHGLVNHTTIGDGLYLTDNDALTQLDGLENLTELGASLEIVDNDSLLDLRALSALSAVSYDFLVANNSSLPTCEVEWLIDNITVTLGGVIGYFQGDGVFVPGSIEVAGNDGVGTCPE